MPAASALPRWVPIYRAASAPLLSKADIPVIANTDFAPRVLFPLPPPLSRALLGSCPSGPAWPSRVRGGCTGSPRPGRRRGAGHPAPSPGAFPRAALKPVGAFEEEDGLAFLHEPLAERRGGDSHAERRLPWAACPAAVHPPGTAVGQAPCCRSPGACRAAAILPLRAAREQTRGGHRQLARCS